jgi:hypothetical protein
MLTDAVIADALKQARVIGCPPKGRRCAVWPAKVTSALETLTSDGWCAIGGVEDARAHGPIWRALFHVDTGEVRLELEVQRPKQRRGRRD